MAQPLLAIDAPSVLYRAFFGLPKTIKGADGKPVNALLGFANLVLREIETHQPRAVAMCFGPDAADYRVELYSGYHAERPEMPDELSPQWAQARDFFGAFNWRTFDTPDLEADDVLGSLARAEERAGGEALIMTGDRDLYQCVTPKVRVLYLKTGSRGGEVVDEAEVKKRYGIPPELVPDFIALRGDPSDGLPGAKGIGEKTAAELLSRHGSLEAVIAAAPKERLPSIRAALENSGDDLRAFKDIATLRAARVRRPADRPTNFKKGAIAARERGMGRLADRLEDLATA